MKIVNTVGVTREPFDVASGLAEILFHLHLAEKFVAAPPAKLHAQSNWFVDASVNTSSSGERNPPSIRAKCICGGNIDRFTGRNPEEEIVLRHKATCDGALEHAPAEVRKYYFELVRAYYPPKTIKAAVTDKLSQLKSALRSGVAQ